MKLEKPKREVAEVRHAWIKAAKPGIETSEN